MRSFAVVNLGCKVNRVESDQVERTLAGLGLRGCAASEADIIVVNTCTVTAAADKKTRKAVRGALSANEHARLVVTGCSAARSPEAFESMSSRVEVVGKWDLDARLRKMVAAASLDAPGLSGEDAPCERAIAGTGVRSGASEGLERFRKGVKVQDGCNGQCAYCIIWKARGPERSVAVADVLEQARMVCAEGASEVVLTGINLGRYRDGEADLASLLKMLLDEGLPCRYRLSSIEPMDVTEQLLSVMAGAKGRVCWHLHIPLQSGSSKVLSEMGRPYSAEDYLGKVAMVRRMLPGVSITTDVIAGFPGETDADHTESMQVARACAFSKLHVFPYSMREGTPAAEREDQVPAGMKAARAASLRELSAELRALDLKARRKTVELAVVSDSGMCMTDSYHELPAPVGVKPGSLVEVEL